MKNEKYYLLTFNKDHCDEFDVPALTVMKEEEYQNWLKSIPEIRAWLGNMSDGFMEDTQDNTGKDLIINGYVNMTVVDENFYKTFHTADLSSLSLCSIFDIDND